MSTPVHPAVEVRYLTVTEVARLLRVSRRTVERRVEDGDLPAVRVGRLIRIPADAIDRLPAADGAA